MSETKHTPLWAAPRVDSGVPHYVGYLWNEDKNYLQAEVYGDTEEEVKQKLDLIVRAVNAHATLVVALELIAAAHAGQTTGGIAAAAIARATGKDGGR